jgi:hypothetical protein
MSAKICQAVPPKKHEKFKKSYKITETADGRGKELPTDYADKIGKKRFLGVGFFGGGRCGRMDWFVDMERMVFLGIGGFFLDGLEGGYMLC